MNRAITMRELQKMSAGVIRALPGTVAIKSGRETVALLTPLKRPDPEKLREVLARIEANYVPLTPEERREVEALVGPIED